MEDVDMAVGEDVSLGTEAPGSVAAPDSATTGDVQDYITSDEIDNDWTDFSEEQPTAGDALQISEQQPSEVEEESEEQAGTAASATAGEEESTTTEESEILKEIARLDGEPNKNWKRLRTIAETNARENMSLSARVQELEQGRGGFQPPVPVDEFNPGDYWGGVAEKYPAYYEKLASDLFRTHTDQMPPDVLTTIMARDFDPLVKHIFGMSGEEIEALIQQHGEPGSAGSPKLPADATNTPDDLAKHFGLETDDPIVKFTHNLMTQVSNLSKQVGDLSKTSNESVDARTKREEGERVNTLNGQVGTERDRLLSKVYSGIPKGHEHLKTDIPDFVDAKLTKDTVYQAAKTRAEKWAKQGNPAEAASDLRVMFARQQAAINEARQKLLDPVVNGIRNKDQARPQPRPQVRSGDNPEPPRQASVSKENLTLAERVKLRGAQTG